MMIGEICAEVKNYFCGSGDRHFGRFRIDDGVIAPLDFLSDGQYFRIIGSTFNDGVYQYPAAGLTDEVFAGAIWAMRVPPEFVALAEEVESYTQSVSAETKEAGWDIFQSQSFGGFSGSVKEDLSWQKHFASQLNRYRRLRV